MRKSHRKEKEAPDLEITSFLNLMIILVPFLLMSAAFSQIAILQLNLPTQASGESDTNQKELTIEVIVREKKIQLGDGKQIVQVFPNKEDGSYDFNGLAKSLIQIKANFPNKLDAQVLMEQDLKYDVLVKTMDAVSIVEAVNAEGEKEKVELFPAISIGDAPGGK